MVRGGLQWVNLVGRNDNNIYSNHSALRLVEQFKRQACMVALLASFSLNYHSRSQSKGFKPNQRPSSCYNIQSKPKIQQSCWDTWYEILYKNEPFSLQHLYLHMFSINDTFLHQNQMFLIRCIFNLIVNFPSI